ncbi:putative alpha-mannosyltransferase [Erysiphe necator]|uniref:Putative alpha-mannosyltransferase n=1 Tax=Uncinula necator TaxID=52586 RepID=A0A0B1P306_UNCNE|nr:putative alpha-mannosyltransferase [Erysiphe necator]
MSSSHLHPKSRLTSSLFATTLFASFFVVVLPHILPCPASKPVAFNDDGTLRTSSNRKCRIQSKEQEKDHPSEPKVVDLHIKTLEKRQCPIRKPRGILESLFGPQSSDNGNSNSENKRTRPPSIEIAEN